MPREYEFRGAVYEVPDDWDEAKALNMIGQVAGPKYNDNLIGKASKTFDAFQSAVGTVPDLLRQSFAGSAQLLKESTKTEFERLQSLEIRDEDREALAQNWYGKPLSLLAEEHAATARERQVLQEMGSEAGGAAAAKTAPYMDDWTRYVVMGTQSLGVSALTLGAGAGVRGVGLAFAGIQQAGQTYSQGGEEGASVEAKQRAALGTGIAEAAFEKIPLDFLLKPGMGTAKRLIGTMVREYATELPTTAVQYIVERANFTPDMPWEEFSAGLSQALVDTALSLPISAGGQTALAQGIQRLNAAYEGKTVGEVVSERAQVAYTAWDRLQAAQELLRNGQATPAEVEAASLAYKQALSPVLKEEAEKALQNIPGIIPNNTLEQNVPDTIADRPISNEELNAALEAAANAPLATAEERAQAREAREAPELVPTAADPAVKEVLATLNEQRGATRASIANAINYPNENDSIPLQEQRLLYASSEGGRVAEERTLGSLSQFGPGTYVIGKETLDRPDEYMELVGATVEQWRQKYMPHRRLVIANESLPGDSLALHYTARGTSFLVPAALRKAKEGVLRNPWTYRAAFYGLSHEFGHALLRDRLDSLKISPAARAYLRGDQNAATLEQLKQELDPALFNVVLEWATLRDEVLSGKLSAREFAQKWMGVALTQRSTLFKEANVSEHAPALELIEAFTSRSDAYKKTKLFKSVDEAVQRYLSFDEYVAEQLSRYAYTKQWAANSPLAQQSWFQKALEDLKNLFRDLKREGWVEPGVRFQEWIEGLPLRENERAGKAAKRGGKKGAIKVKEAQKTPIAPKPKTARKPKLETTNSEALTKDTAKVKEALNSIKWLVQDGALDKGSKKEKQLRELVEKGQWEELRLELRKVYSKVPIHFSLGSDWVDAKLRRQIELAQKARAPGIIRSVLAGDTFIEDDAKNAEVIKAAQAAWKKYGPASPFFKRWFGDWQNPNEASGLKDAQGRPLRVYHYTPFILPGKHEALFTAFLKGDIGFHFGTREAAHRRRYGTPPAIAFNAETGATEIKFPNMEAMEESVRAEIETGLDNPQYSAAKGRPVFVEAWLAIKNPLDIGQEDASIWDSAVYFAQWLQAKGLLSEGEVRTVQANLKPAQTWDRYERMTPLREVLLAKGYDGVVYDNLVEGDRSYVAFLPNQIKATTNQKTFSDGPDYSFAVAPDFDDADAVETSLGRVQKVWDRVVPNSPMLKAKRFFSKALKAVLQLQQYAHLNPDISGLGLLAQYNTEYTQYKSSMQAQPDRLIENWKEFEKERSGHLAKALYAEVEGGTRWATVTADSPVPGRRKWSIGPTEKLYEEMKLRGIDYETPLGRELIEHYLQTQQTLLDQFSQLERTLAEVLGKRFREAALVLQLRSLKATMDEVVQRPFFPKAWFGDYVVTVRTLIDGRWRTTHMEAFMNEEDWINRTAELEARKGPNQKIGLKLKISEATQVMMGIPQDFAKIAAEELQLTEEQYEHLIDMLEAVNIDRRLTPYDEKRLRVTGQSSDAMRAYADFTWHNSNMIAKLRYRAKFNFAIQVTQSALYELDKTMAAGAEKNYQVLRLAEAISYMSRVRDYVMHPPNEMQQLRALTSMAYLGFNVKTATLNLYGLVTTWAHLTSSLGTVEGTRVLLSAMNSMRKTVRFGDLNASRPQALRNAEDQHFFDRAIEEGILTQSYAYHLASMSNAGDLHRMWADSTFGRLGRRGMEAAMYAFRLTELGARRATFIAELEHQRKNGLRGEELYQAAVANTNKLQNDYSLGNRVPFMRGDHGKFGWIMPVATIFMSFAQHMAFHAFGGYEAGLRALAREQGATPRNRLGGYTMRIWLLTLLVAGLEGLPGFENLFDLLEGLYKKLFGKSFRQDLREFAQDLGVSPQLAMHGLGYNVFGFDLSRSVGFGRMVPGTDTFARSSADAVGETGNLLFDLFGPFGGIAKLGVEAVFSDKSWADLATRAPGAAGQVMSALRWTEEGVRAPNGARILRDRETGELRDPYAWEIAGKALGFNPTAVSESRTIRYAQLDMRLYWSQRREGLMDDAWKAFWRDDREAMADTMKAIKEYNSEIPQEFGPALRITGKDLIASRKTRMRALRAEEAQMPPEKRYRQLHKNVNESFH